jgi:protein involved in polysaccharide export with SLBB domain
MVGCCLHYAGKCKEISLAIIKMRYYVYTLVALVYLTSLGFAQAGAGASFGALGGQSGNGGTTSDCMNNPSLPGCGGGAGGQFSPLDIAVHPPAAQHYDDRSFTEVSETAKRSTNPPAPPTEFQRFVLESTGIRLPIFGSSLFQDVPSTFAPVAGIPVSADYVLGPGDELSVRVWGQLNVELTTIIDRSGQIYFPQVGSMTVAGVKYGNLTSLLKANIGKVYKNFDLTVSMGHLRSIQIFVVGYARRPGSYTIGSFSTLLNALFASGGPNPQGSLRNIQLKRDGNVVAEFDLYDFLLKGDKSKDVHLQPGDVIFIPPIGPVVAMTGSVQTPAIYELKGKTTLGDALAMVGGLNTVADAQKAVVERIDEHRIRAMQEFTLDQSGLARELKDGDIVQVISIVPKFENAVTIRGNVANPGRYPWREGMKLRDLIPNREFLLTREYWRNQNLLGSQSPALGAPRTWEELNQAAAPTAQQQQQLPNQQQLQLQPGLPQQMQTSVPGQTPGAEAGARGAPQAQTLGGSTAAQEVNNQAFATGQESRLPGSQLGRTTPRPQGAESAAIDIRRSAPEINWDYAVIQRLNPDDLTTRLLPFGLGRLVLDHDESQNLALMPGDVVTIFSQRDLQVPMARRSKFVRIEGEVRAPGVYRAEPGDNLRTMVQRAGGLTPAAYLYGTDFTRESLRVEQQRGLDTTIRNMELSLASGGASGGVLVKTLHELQASGRMVLELHPSDKGVNALPALPLEDGDRLAIPNMPNTVNVVGAVANQSSYIFSSGKRVGDYLRLAGQGTREADRKHAFLIRADGSVISKDRTSGLWSGGFDSLHVLPGDIIVIPPKVLRANRLQAVQQWSQLFSQFAIGAASLAVVTGY